jgi:hypothetical protein
VKVGKVKSERRKKQDGAHDYKHALALGCVRFFGKAIYAIAMHDDKEWKYIEKGVMEKVVNGNTDHTSACGKKNNNKGADTAPRQREPEGDAFCEISEHVYPQYNSIERSMSRFLYASYLHIDKGIVPR